MKKPFYLCIIVLSFITLLSTGCFKSDPIESDIPVYSSFESIINPPDNFQIVFTLISSLDYSAIVQFNSNAVWKVERINVEVNNNVWVERADITEANRYEVINSQTQFGNIGFEGEVRYRFIASKASYPSNTDNSESITLFLEFTKLPDEDYNTHSIKI